MKMWMYMSDIEGKNVEKCRVGLPETCQEKGRSRGLLPYAKIKPCLSY